MKAPELPTKKIYFTILDMGSGYIYPSLDDNGGTEYIRKDAVLDILKNSMHLADAASIILKIDKL